MEKYWIYLNTSCIFRSVATLPHGMCVYGKIISTRIHSQINKKAKGCGQILHQRGKKRSVEDKEMATAIQINHLHASAFKHGKQLNRLHFTAQRTRQLQVQFQVRAASARQLIQSGEVRPILPKDAAAAINSDGFVLLDIRPVWEREKAHVTGSLHVPLFVEDKDYSPVTLLKKWVHFGYIGLWTGQNFTMLNPDFLQQVEGAVPDKNSKLLVACGEGLRSMMAASKLYEGGYKNLGWLAGGFNRAVDDDFPDVEGEEKLQYATIGGVSYYFLQLLLILQSVGKSS